jgi:hypothetical protein
MEQARERGDAALVALPDLQPGRAPAAQDPLPWWFEALQDVLGQTEQTLVGKGHHDVEAALQSLRQRQLDRSLLDDLAQDGWQGPGYEVFQADLVAYGLPILMDWIYTGKIFALCGGKGRPVPRSDRAGELLQSDRAERLGLTHEVLVLALRLFHERTLVPKAWTIEGGASVHTFFMGAVILAFPGPYRRWFTDQQRWSPRPLLELSEALGNGESMRWRDDTPGADPEAVAIRKRVIAGHLARITDPLTRKAAAMVADGMTRAEVGEALGLSEDAVNMRLLRLRDKLRRTQSAAQTTAPQGKERPTKGRSKP